jgi:hypothetical protein
VVFPAEQAREQGIGEWFVQNGQTAEYWTPSESDVLVLENGLAPYLEHINSDRFNREEAPVWERLDEYNRQYIGILLDGKRFRFRPGRWGLFFSIQVRCGFCRVF